MKKRWQLTFISISLISLSTFFYLPLLNWAISNNYLSIKNIQFLASLNRPEFHYIQYQKTKRGTNQWLTSSQFLAKRDSNIALVLADYYFSKKQINAAVLWYKQALQLGNVNAAQPLAEYWFAEKAWSHSLSLAKQYNQHFWAQRLIVNIAVIQGNLSDLYFIENRLAQSNHGQDLLEQLNRYQVINNNNLTVTPPNSSCLSLQLFATTLNDLQHSSTLINQIKQTEIGRYFCFNTPKYISKDMLDCQYSPEQAIRCNESIWHQYSDNITTRYLGVLLPSGGANVHSGILYLDRNDGVDVFKHELLHLLGFIDEYPLPIDHPFCQSINELPYAHNIAVLKDSYQGSRTTIRQKILSKIPWGHLIESSTPILYETHKGWQVGTPNGFTNKVGVFPVDTCKHSEFVSVKPLTVQTTLTYYELPLPQEYKDFLITGSRKYLMPSYHYNVAQALENQGNKISAQEWLNLAKSF